MRSRVDLRAFHVATVRAGMLSAALVAGLFAEPAAAQTSYPMLMSLHPIAVQAGTSAEIEVSARYSLEGTYKILVTGSGVAGEALPGESAQGRRNADKWKVRFTAEAGAQPGVREVRLATPRGVSTVGQLVVVRDPVIAEKTPNDTREQAQAVELPAALCGVIEKAEDVDFYRFSAAAGTTLTFHVRCGRLQDKIHDLQLHADPLLTIRDAQGNTLASSDNDFFADPCLTHRFEQAGEYLLEVRDVRYNGNAYWAYCVEASSRPFVTNLYPLAFNPGATANVELIGVQLPEAPMSQLVVPAEQPAGPMTVGVPMGGDVTNPVPVLASALPQSVEIPDQTASVSAFQMIAVPAGISGRIESAGDVDVYGFEAKRGESFNFEVTARRVQSSLDSVLRIRNGQNQSLAENDDTQFGRLVHSDSRIEGWTAPADGTYFVEVTDLHGRGGTEFVYFLQAERAAPSFELSLDSDKTILAPGGFGTIFVRCVRKQGFAGEIALSVEGLPAGVTAQCGRILAGGRDGCIVLGCAADAPVDAAEVRIVGRGEHPAAAEGEPPLVLTAAAQPMQEIYFPGGGRGHFPVDTHVVSVAGPLDLTAVTLGETEIVLKPGETKTIPVTIARANGFNQNVTLDVIYRHLGTIFGDSLPAGVTMDENASQTLLTGNQSQGSIVLKAAADAKPVERQQISVMANVSINFVMKMTYSGPAVYVSVRP